MAKAFSALAPLEPPQDEAPWLREPIKEIAEDTVRNTSFSRGLVKERVPKYAFVKLDSSSMVVVVNTADLEPSEIDKSMVLTGTP